jgi:integrase
MAKRVTVIAQQKARAKASKTGEPVRLNDGNGLYYWAYPDGFAWNGCLRVKGDPRVINRTYKDSESPADARAWFAAEKAMAKRGVDPRTAEREAKAKEQEAALDTVEAISTEYFASSKAKKLRSAQRQEATLRRCVYPVIGGRPVAELKRREINRLLDRIEQRGETVPDEVLRILNVIFRWHAVRDDDFNNPLVPGMRRTKAKERERTRVLTDAEIQAIWLAAERLSSTFAYLVQLLLLTAARRNEVAHATWSEFSGGIWTLPQERSKTKTEVVRPLSHAALQLLADIPEISGCPHVFTNARRGPFTAFSRGKKKFDAECGVGDWTLHDLRRTARSLMSRAGVPVDHAERCLGHAIAGVRGTYDRHRYLDEMKFAFEKLAALIEGIVRPKTNVVPLHG